MLKRSLCSRDWGPRAGTKRVRYESTFNVIRRYARLAKSADTTPHSGSKNYRPNARFEAQSGRRFSVPSFVPEGSDFGALDRIRTCDPFGGQCRRMNSNDKGISGLLSGPQILPVS